MTHKKLTFLFLFIIAVLPCWIFVSWARASDEIDWNVSGYVTGNFAGGSGYDPGIGILGEVQARWKFLEIKLSASTAWQKKKTAKSGYTGGGNGQLRCFFFQDLYAVGSYSVAGYKSVFDNGTEWAKHGDNLGFGLGWETDFIDLNLIYYLKETSSPNDIQYTALSVRYQIWKWLWATGSLKRVTFDQTWDGQLERWSSMNWSMGLGVRF